MKSACLVGLSLIALASCGSISAPETQQAAAESAACPSEGAALQVLGSGGPIAEAGRAATSYLLWIDGEPRLLIDAGSGSFLRFAEAGGKIETLDAILITHLHADHAGDLVDVLNTGGFEGRTEPLAIVGPDAAPRFPGMAEFIERLIGKEGGAFAYNGGFLDGTENKPELIVREVETAEGAGEPAGLDISNDYSVMAHPVHHGPVPALGYVVEVGDASFVITGDQSFLSERFLSDLTGINPTIFSIDHMMREEDGGVGARQVAQKALA